MTLAAHLDRALSTHARWCRENGHVVPVELVALLDEAKRVARPQAASDGQGRPIVARSPSAFDDASETLTLTYEQAAARLNVSLRSVRRYVAAGSLLSVEVCGTRRIRSVDLAAYVEGL